MIKPVCIFAVKTKMFVSIDQSFGGYPNKSTRLVVMYETEEQIAYWMKRFTKEAIEEDWKILPVIVDFSSIMGE